MLYWVHLMWYMVFKRRTTVLVQIFAIEIPVECRVFFCVVWKLLPHLRTPGGGLRCHQELAVRECSYVATFSQRRGI